ncbi:SGNH/GDSL hydrolase family protein [Isachenkonia alkalipeptolytica]|uniref:SGNH hydrolase-type esterase domain-containing protein n=1 Tax=Isachenkonia alkalipeptolytica TaxID=2565777 RepID=A0AA43XHV7_9CLOT|nr:GDSL-type esterase/lipase family protein [Isachenkonia alkalipeptolytica]NBG86902.1 hypothetical protein [Isachenkonia alkalipeptolytica]
MYKKWMVFILVVIMILALPINALAARPNAEARTYLNLGDSIARGTGVDPMDAYFSGYSEYLSGFGFEGGNMAFDGVTSSWILNELLYTDWMQEAVEEADVITISIGGNNILQPVIGAMMKAYNAQSISELEEKIVNGGPDIWDIIIQQLLADDELRAALWLGVEDFQSHWPQIINAIHYLNEEANIIILSIYNPVCKMESPELYQLMEELIRPMNQTMRENQGRRVSVANVYNAFRRNEDAVNFSIAWPINLDPHPTNIGHQLIVEELMRVRNPRVFAK